MTKHSDSVTFSIRIDRQLLERIDRGATQHGESRTAYILRWLPDAYEPTKEAETD